MKNLTRLSRISQILAYIVFIGLIFSSLALMDIYQNIEPDLSLEWFVVRITFLFTLIYLVISSLVIMKSLKK
jgi:hypothetical protein